VLVEPFQASAGGRCASPAFYREVARACGEAGALLVFDELLTGWHRTGPPFVFADFGLTPDIVLVGKAMGNGFPVSGVVMDRRHPVEAAMLPGSTFSDNPLAAAAVVGTLTAMRELRLPERVAAIEKIVREAVEPLASAGITVRGRGALWVLELPDAVDAEATVRAVYAAGVAVGWTRQYLRLLPPATIRPERLAAACGVIAATLLEGHGHA
jgi:acetylornithine/succinyldiaminopimelate/putrescine aminotransferase